jgi:hypothetical protein
MELIVQIPDDLALEEFKSRHFTKPEFRRLLGFGIRYALNSFLKSRGVYQDCTMEDFARSPRPEATRVLTCSGDRRRYGSEASISSQVKSAVWYGSRFFGR